jgi:hypothetical protein
MYMRIKYFFGLFVILVVGFPLVVHFSGLAWALDATLMSNFFPAFGLLAFTLMWLHVVTWPFDFWLKKHVDLKKFNHTTSLVVLFSIIIHPLLFFMQIGLEHIGVVFSSEGAFYLWLGVIAWFMLITLDVGKALKKRGFFVKHWNKIIFISTIGFLLTFFHSLGLGSDLQAGPLRLLWIFYGITAILATIYTYGIRRFVEKRDI